VTAAALAVAVGLALQAGPGDAARVRCTEEQSVAAVEAFLAAWNTGDAARLDALVAPDETFSWFIATGETTFVTYSRERFLDYATRRHRAGDRMTLRRLSPGPGGFTYELVREAAGLNGGHPTRYGGKGLARCEGAEPAIGVWAMGSSRPSPPVRPAGASWEALRRPLHLPVLEPGSECPRSDASAASRRSSEFDTGFTLGPGPVYPLVAVGASTEPPGVVRTKPLRSTRRIRVLWIASPRYGGPALVRGRRLDGPQPLVFDSGGELRLWDVARNAPGSWRRQASELRLRAPGCYAVQIDGRHFSKVVTFEAAAP
jgi:ketosteroid isomerase-like protein